jgi:2-oxoglutarate dehydrogenase E1 component
VKRLVLCSGKVYVDLVSSDQRKAGKDNGGGPRRRTDESRTAVSLPGGPDRAVLDGYPRLREVCWVQEEPENMGAWEFVRPLLEQLIDGRWPLRYIGRVRNSSPSEGSATWHHANQRAIVAQTFEEKADTRDADRVLSKQV